MKDGKDKKFCPYFYNIHRSKYEANLTIMTYNYILNPFIRKGLNIVEKNSIIILDEAHNICDIFENINSRKISLNDLEQIQKLLQIIIDFINEKGNIFYVNKENINPLLLLNKKMIDNQINIIKAFIDYINKLNFDEVDKCKRYDLFNQIYYLCEVEFFLRKFNMFKVNLYSDIYKKFNTSKSEDKKDLNKFYVKSNEYKKETKLSSLMKLLSKISEFLILLEPFYIPSRESDINSIPAAPLFYEDFKQDEINTEESEKKEEKETKKDKESYKRIIKGEDINSFRFIVLKEEN